MKLGFVPGIVLLNQSHDNRQVFLLLQTSGNMNISLSVAGIRVHCGETLQLATFI